IGSSTFAPRGLAPSLPDGAFRLTSGGVTVGWGVGPGATWEGPQPHAAAIEVSGVVLHGVYDLVRALEQLLPDDLRALLGDSDPIPMGSAGLGDPAAIALRDAAVEPGVVFDVRNGPVVLESGAEVRAGARLEGPLWIGANAHVLGGPVRASAIGPRTNARERLGGRAAAQVRPPVRLGGRERQPHEPRGIPEDRRAGPPAARRRRRRRHPEHAGADLRLVHAMSFVLGPLLQGQGTPTLFSFRWTHALCRKRGNTDGSVSSSCTSSSAKGRWAPSGRRTTPSFDASWRSSC